MLTGMPKPFPDLDTATFWEGCARGEFLIPRCVEGRHPRWPPGPMCPVCQSTHTAWEPAGGDGRVYSWTVVTHPVDAALVGQTPYVVALVDLPEGVRVIANLVDCSPDAVVADMPVRLLFEDQEGLNVPNFRPTPQG